MKDQAAKAIAGAVVGALIGWTGNALTLGGRVSAIEQSLIRIESRLDLRTSNMASLQDSGRPSPAPAVSPGAAGLEARQR